MDSESINLGSNPSLPAEEHCDEDGRLGDRGRERISFPAEEGLGEPWVPQVRMSPSQ